jgi:iron(III) transport system ATP-binding protein
VRCLDRVGRNSAVAVWVRPEDVELSETPPAHGLSDNVCVAAVEAKAFLGDRLDFQVRAGDTLLLARAPPSLRTPVGDKIYVRLQADACLAVPDRKAR